MTLQADYRPAPFYKEHYKASLSACKPATATKMRGVKNKDVVLKLRSLCSTEGAEQNDCRRRVDLPLEGSAGQEFNNRTTWGKKCTTGYWMKRYTCKPVCEEVT